MAVAGTEPEEVVDATPVQITDAADFDPEGGDGEHSEESQLAFDGDSETAWTTEDYETADYNGKSGVGLYVEAARPVAPAAIEITTPDPGWSMTLYGANEPSESLEDWTELEQVESIGDTERLVFDDPDRTFRYFLVWSTSPTETEDGFGASIAEVEVSG